MACHEKMRKLREEGPQVKYSLYIFSGMLCERKRIGTKKNVNVSVEQVNTEASEKY